MTNLLCASDNGKCDLLITGVNVIHLTHSTVKSDVDIHGGGGHKSRVAAGTHNEVGHKKGINSCVTAGG